MTQASTHGKRIRELCEIHHLSQKELAERIGCAPSQISRIITTDTKTISSELLVQIAQEFQVSTDYLLGLTDVPRPQTGFSGSKKHIPMRLMSTAFSPGHCMELIQSITDPDDREMALAEYYYFSGQPQVAVEHAALYLNHENLMLRLSANLICCFANLSLNHINSARMSLDSLHVNLQNALETKQPPQDLAMTIFVANAATTLLHLPLGNIPSLSEYLTELPSGMQLWGSYVLAHHAYLQQKYETSLGIVQTCLMLSQKTYPIAMIYLNLVAAMDAMNLMNRELAEKYFMDAWKLAQPDDLIEGIGEHHGLLQGLIETCLRKNFPDDYKRIIQITYNFSYGWRRIHNPDTHEAVADNLTTTEFTIAMLANRGWSNTEISDYLNITLRTVKQHLTSVYNKLGISNRKQLHSYMLR